MKKTLKRAPAVFLPVVAVAANGITPLRPKLAVRPRWMIRPLP